MTTEDKEMCPLCMEPMEADDLAFYPCDCRYQICRFCWAKIINEENGLCPACRKEYNSEKPASYKPVTDIDDSRSKPSRKRKDYLKKTKLSSEMLKVLPELRVVQPNLIFVVGLPTWISKDKEILKGVDYFGRYGKIYKVEVNQNQTFGGPQGQPSFSAYITYYQAEDAMRAIRNLNQSTLHGRPIRVSLGTTKYCSQFLRGTKCSKHECMYLHELGDPAASFTKEEMQAGKHTEYMNKLLHQYSQSTSSTSTIHAENIVSHDSVESATSGPITALGTELPVSFTSIRKELSNLTVNRGRLRHDHPSHLSTDSHTHFRSTDRGRPQPSQSAESRTSRSTTANEPHSVNQYNKSYLLSDNDVLNLQPTTRDSNNSSKISKWNTSFLLAESLSKKNAKGSLFHSYSLTSGAISDTGGSGNSCISTKDEQTDHTRLNATEDSFTDVIDNNNSNNNNNNDNNSNCNNCNTNNSDRLWCGSSSRKSTCLGDEPVDIDFDPFRESQQGLAELLAAEVSQLDLVDLSCKLNPNESSRLSESTCKPQNSTGSSKVRNPQEQNYTTIRARDRDYSWYPPYASPLGTNQCSGSHSDSTNSHLFQTNIYPPPGFEEAMKVQQQSPKMPFPPSTLPQTLVNLCFSPAQRECTNINNGISYDSNGLSDSSPSSSYNTGSTGFPNNRLEADLTTFDSWSSQSKMSDLVSVPNCLYQSMPITPDALLNCVKQDSPNPAHQLMTNIFTAAFNTASAMLNNGGSPIGCDKSSVRCGPSTFDLNLFFNQLCRQSSLFSSLTAQTLSGWSDNLSASSTNNNRVATTNVQTDLIGSSSPSTRVTISGTGSTAFSPSKLPQSAYLSSTDHDQYDVYAGCHSKNLPKDSNPISSTGFYEVYENNNFTYNHCDSDLAVDSQTGPTVSWQLDDPAIVSSRVSSTFPVKIGPTTASWKLPTSSTSSNTDLLQQIWQGGSNFQPLLESSNLLPPYSSHTQTKLASQSQQSRDSIIQSASHVQLTE